MNHTERTIACFANGLSCSQALLTVYGPELGLTEDIARKISRAFVGGMGFMGETCGVVTAAFMLLGLQYNEADINFYVGVFAENFKCRNGSITCKDLLGCDISTPDGLAFMMDKNLKETHCARFLKDASEFIENIIFENE